MIADSQGVQLNLFPFYWYRKRRLDFFFLTGKWPFLNLENVLFDGLGGVGWDGWDGISKVSFNFLYTSWVYRSCVYLLIYVIKFCHQHSYGFQNLISSWRVWISFLKLLRGNVFFKNHAKSKVFQNSYGQRAFFDFFFQI